MMTKQFLLMKKDCYSLSDEVFFTGWFKFVLFSKSQFRLIQLYGDWMSGLIVGTSLDDGL